MEPYSLKKQMEAILAQKNNIIQQLTHKLQEQQHHRIDHCGFWQEFENQYIKTTIAHLQATDLIITNGVGDLCCKYALLDVSKIQNQCSFICHKDAIFVPIHEIGDKIFPTTLSQQAETANNYCNMLLEDLSEIRGEVRVLQKQVEKLQKEKQTILSSSASPEKPYPQFIHGFSQNSKPMRDPYKRPSDTIPIIEHQIETQSQSPEREVPNSADLCPKSTVKNEQTGDWQSLFVHFKQNSEKDALTQSKEQTKDKNGARGYLTCNHKDYQLENSQKVKPEDLLGKMEETPRPSPSASSKKKEKIIFIRK